MKKNQTAPPSSGASGGAVEDERVAAAKREADEIAAEWFPEDKDKGDEDVDFVAEGETVPAASLIQPPTILDLEEYFGVYHDEDLLGNPDLMRARLVFLIARNQTAIPEQLCRYLPDGDWLKELHRGPAAAGFLSSELMKQFEVLYYRGSELGPGGRDEVISILGMMLERELANRTDVSVKDRMALWNSLNRLTDNQLLTPAEFDLSHPPTDITDVPKFECGFTPIDVVFSQVYQGILMMMGKPGTGKTSLMLSMAEAAVKAQSCSSILFVENEIPEKMMLGRMAPIFRRVSFPLGSTLIVASWTSHDILDWIIEHPDPDRIVFFDGPDVIVGGIGEGKRFVLEDSYQTLIQVKALSKMVVVSSQPRRKDSNNPSLESPAEAWAKAWYVDMMCGIQDLGNNQIRLLGAKNRFGPKNQKVTFTYDYATLEWTMEGVSADREDLNDW